MAKALQKALLQQQRTEDDGKHTARPQDLIRLYDIILQVMLKKENQAKSLFFKKAFKTASLACKRLTS